MEFGFNIMLPAFGGSLLLLLYYKKKIMALPTVLFFLELFVFANKGAIITAIVLIIVGYVFFAHGDKISLKSLIFIVLIGATIYAFRYTILDFVLDITRSKSITSYSISTFGDMLLSGRNSSVYSTRTNLWTDAWQMFCKKPFFGYGIGYVEATTSNYPHNFFFDILTSFGLFVTVPFLVAILWSISNMFRVQSKEKQIFIILILILWFIPMMVSLTLWKVLPFWVYWGCFLFPRREYLYKSLSRNNHGGSW
jgi:O-antigen ligase